MRKAIRHAVGFGCAGVAVMVLAQAMAQQPSAEAPNPDSQCRLGPDDDNDNVAVSRVDRRTGGLGFTGHDTAVGNPSCIVFLDLGRVG